MKGKLNRMNGRMNGRMSGKTAIVTGGLGALGLVVAAQFMNTGVRVAIPGRPGSHAIPLPAELRGEEVLLAEADIAVESDVRSFVGEVVARFGGIDFLVNAAGGYAGGEAIGQVPLETFEAMLSGNLRTAFLMCSAVIPLMRERRFGRIVNIAAMPALAPVSLRGPYAIAKRGVVTLTETIAAEVKGSGITANALVPSIIDTPANRSSMPSADPSRWVTPEELGRIILFLCSDDAKSVSGNALKVYGAV